MRANFEARLWGVIAGLLCLAGVDIASAQYSFVETPFNSASNSFYENIGVSWGLQGRGWFANFGGAGGGVPAGFGGFDPNAQATFGAGFRGNGFSGHFNMTAGQGSDSSLTTSTPGVMVPNGGMGFFSDVQQRPFVLGVIPVIGEGVSPVRWRLDRMAEQGNSPGSSGASNAEGSQDNSGSGSSGASTAERGDLSVAAIKAQQAAEAAAKAGEVSELLAKARDLEAAGKITSAKIQYRRAAQRATGKEQQEIAAKLRELEKK